MTLDKDLYNLIKKSEFAAAKEYIINHPSIDLNALDSNNHTILMKVILKDKNTPEYLELIDYILNHPNFTSASYTYNERSSFDFALSYCADIEIIKLLIKHQDKGIDAIERQNGQLQWHCVQKLIKAQLDLKDMECRANPNYDCASDHLQVSNWFAISKLLYDALIKKALKDDDDTLLRRLKAAGGDPTKQINDETMGTFRDRLPDVMAQKMGKTRLVAYYEELEQQEIDSGISFLPFFRKIQALNDERTKEIYEADELKNSKVMTAFQKMGQSMSPI